MALAIASPNPLRPIGIGTVFAVRVARTSSWPSERRSTMLVPISTGLPTSTTQAGLNTAMRSPVRANRAPGFDLAEFALSNLCVVNIICSAEPCPEGELAENKHNRGNVEVSAGGCRRTPNHGEKRPAGRAPIQLRDNFTIRSRQHKPSTCLCQSSCSGRPVSRCVSRRASRTSAATSSPSPQLRTNVRISDRNASVSLKIMGIGPR
jgi:hypothetical protein